jgi:hypothetical protein
MVIYLIINSNIFIAYFCIYFNYRAETCPFSADFHPFIINYSEIQSFHGSLCRHYAPTNPSESTRVSIDFRIGIDKYFDINWELKGLKGKHGRKNYQL